MADAQYDIRLRLSAEPPSDKLPPLLSQELQETIAFFNEDSDSQFRRRVFFRNAFAFIEGILHYFKLSTYSHYYRVVKPVVLFWFENFDLEFPETGFCRLVDEDVLLTLLDRQVQIDEKGVWKLKEGWLTTATNVRFTFRVMAEVYGLSEIAVDGNGWKALKDSITVRNRVTHPKVLEEFDITDQEIKDLETALNWFHAKIEEIIPEIINGFAWDGDRVKQLMAQVPDDQIDEFRGRLMEIFQLDERGEELGT